MKIYKMHARGNDYILTIYQQACDYSSLAIKICDRHTGVGALGLIVIKENPLEMLFYNSLGKREITNANALCCCSKLISDLKISRRNSFDIITYQGVVNVEVIQEIPFLCRLNLGVPNFNNQMIYVNDCLDSFGRIIKVNGVDINTYSFNLSGVNTVVFIDSFESRYLSLAKDLANSPLFKRHTNVTFVQVINKLKIKCKTYDWASGFLLSSGTGCAAAALASYRLGLTKGRVTALEELGDIFIEITKHDNVYIEAGATNVFDSCYNEEEE